MSGKLVSAEPDLLKVNSPVVRRESRVVANRKNKLDNENITMSRNVSFLRN